MSLFGKNQDKSQIQSRDEDRFTLEGERGGEVAPERARGPASPIAVGLRGETMANIGKSISIKGDLTGSEDLVIEGSVEGKVELPTNELTVGENGKVRADVHAKSVVVIGSVSGNVSAVERVEIQATGLVEGDVRAPRLVIHEGARLNGAVEMTEGKPPAKAEQPKAAVG